MDNALIYAMCVNHHQHGVTEELTAAKETLNIWRWNCGVVAALRKSDRRITNPPAVAALTISVGACGG